MTGKGKFGKQLNKFLKLEQKSSKDTMSIRRRSRHSKNGVEELHGKSHFNLQIEAFLIFLLKQLNSFPMFLKYIVADLSIICS